MSFLTPLWPLVLPRSLQRGRCCQQFPVGEPELTRTHPKEEGMNNHCCCVTKPVFKNAWLRFTQMGLKTYERALNLFNNSTAGRCGPDWTGQHSSHPPHTWVLQAGLLLLLCSQDPIAMVCQQDYQHVPSWIHQCSFGSDQTPRHSSDKYLLLNPCVPEKKIWTQTFKL